MTGKVYAVVAEKLEEAVERILKVKDEVYYRGFASNEFQDSPSSSTNTPNLTEQPSKDTTDSPEAVAEENDPIVDDDDWKLGYLFAD
jgi:hypothetical protein